MGFIFIIGIGLLVLLGLWIVVRTTMEGRRRLTVSQMIFIVEFTLLVIPCLVLTSVIALLLVFTSWASIEDVLEMSGFIVAILLPTICGMRLSVAFVNGGAPALRAIHPAWWWGACAGAMVIGVCFVADQVGPLDPDYYYVVDLEFIATMGAPLLIPFLHLVLERQRAAPLAAAS